MARVGYFSLGLVCAFGFMCGMALVIPFCVAFHCAKSKQTPWSLAVRGPYGK